MDIENNTFPVFLKCNHNFQMISKICEMLKIWGKFVFSISIENKISSKILKKYILQKCSFVKTYQFKLNDLLIIITFRFYSNILPKIFIRLQKMGSLQDENQNSENLGMTQGAPVNKCIRIPQNGDNSPGTLEIQ